MEQSAQGHLDTADALFGSGESSDFFATITGTSQSQAPVSPSSLTTPSHLSAEPSTDIFETYDSGNDHHYEDGTAAAQAQSYDEQGWYDDYGQWHPYENELYSDHAGGYAAGTYVPSQSTYAPPQPTYTPPQPTYTPPQPTYTPQQSLYQPQVYAPSQQSYAPQKPAYALAPPLPAPAPAVKVENPYSPAKFGVNGTPVQSIASSSTYDPYAPPSSHVRQQSFSSTKPFVMPKAAPPPPPVRAGGAITPKSPSVEAFRSTTYNAYDPPMPDITSRYTRPAKPVAPVYDPYAPTATSYLPPPKAKLTAPPPPSRSQVSPAPLPAPRTLPPPGNSYHSIPHVGNSFSAPLRTASPSHSAVPRALSPPTVSLPPESSLRREPSQTMSSTEGGQTAQPVNHYPEPYTSPTTTSPRGSLDGHRDPEGIYKLPLMDQDTGFSAGPNQSIDTRLTEIHKDDILGLIPHAPDSFETVSNYNPSRADPDIRSKGSSEPHALTQSYRPSNGVMGAPVKDGQPMPYDPYNPTTSVLPVQPTLTTSPPQMLSKTIDPYAPTKAVGGQYPNPVLLSNAPAPLSSSSKGVDPYAPLAARNPYVPAPLARSRQPSEASDYDAAEYSTRYNHQGASSLGQELSYSPPDYKSVPATTQAYAPSPSLLGTNDPLGRASARVPVISFGFGGKLVSCFHDANKGADLGFDVSLSSRPNSIIQIQVLHTVIPSSAIDPSTSPFPGPLFSDSASPATSIALPGTVNPAKAKKPLVLKYLEERINETEAGLGYVGGDSALGRSKAEGRLILVKLLRLLVENDGKLSGSPQIESAVRKALVPRVETGFADPAIPLVAPFSFASPPALDLQLSGTREPPLATYYLRSSSLDKLQELLLRGDRRQAYHYALDEKLWGHALLISSSVDKEAWKEVASEFIKAELGPLSGLNTGSLITTTPPSNGRESLRVAYSLFAGHGAAAVQELLPPKVFNRSGADLLVKASSAAHPIPLSPNFPSSSVASTIPVDSLARWADIAATIIANQTTGDSVALSTLGDYLLANKWTEAAHVCYLLSSQTSHIGGIGAPSARIVLVGSESPANSRTWHKDFDSILFSEITEYALALAPTAKGQEPFSGIPHLQAYRLVRASHLAEMGHIQLATRYCDAIRGSLRLNTKGSPFYTMTFREQLTELSDRLIAAPHLDKTASWISRSLTKPSIDTLSNWIEGRFTKFIEGDEPAPETVTDDAIPVDKPVVGPFSHYSNISSTNSSTSPSPSTSVSNLANGGMYPRRTGSAMAHSPPMANPYVPIDRSVSAMDHLRPTTRQASPPAPRISSANAITTTFQQAYSPFKSDYDSSQSSIASTPDNSSTTLTEGDGGRDSGSWWGSPNYGQESSTVTPTATSFYPIDGNANSNTGEFISLMAPYSFDTTDPPATARPSATNQGKTEADDEEDDLGFGNSKPKPKAQDPKADESKPSDTPQPDKPTSENQEANASSASSGGWLSRWFTRRDDVPKAVKANLGEETSFVYDKELKRWVNRKAGAEPPAPAVPPPPPARSQTASPGRAAGSPLPVPAPPPRSSSAAGNLLTSQPTKPATRMRSNLIPSEDEGGPPRSATSSPVPLPPRGSTSTPPIRGSTATPPPPRASTATPPLGGGLPVRPKSQAGKKSVRSRYVDVFQQPAEQT